MQLNVSTCYAMQIMLYLTKNKRIVSSTELAGHLRISQRYTLHIAGILRDGGMINAFAGMNGGYSLSRDASSFSVYDIVTLLEGDMSIPDCVMTPVPDCGEPCCKSDLFETLSIMKELLDSYLKIITFDKLQDMNMTGRLNEILDLVESHIEEMKH